MKIAAFFICFFLSVSTYGTTLSEIIEAYRIENNQPANFVPTSAGCYDRQSECYEKACDRLGTWACKSPTDSLEVLNACNGNFSGDCLVTACSMAGSFGCRNRKDVLDLVYACRGNYSDFCLKTVCQKMGPFDCDSQLEVIQILKACAQ